MPHTYASHISRTRSCIAKLTDAMEGTYGCLSEYLAIGGSDAILPYFQTTDATPVDRTDLTFTHAEFVSAIATLDAMRTFLASGHMTNLYKMKD